MPLWQTRAKFRDMDERVVNSRIPRLELGCSSGTKINSSDFAGHDLIVLFGPLDPVSSEREIASYHHHCAELVDRDVWLLAFTEHCDELNIDGAGRVLIIPDSDRHAWVAFRDLTHHAEEMDRDSGATFLFTRGGALNRYWHGSGHVDEVLAELRTPRLENPHQLAT